MYKQAWTKANKDDMEDDLDDIKDKFDKFEDEFKSNLMSYTIFLKGEGLCNFKKYPLKTIVLIKIFSVESVILTKSSQSKRY